LLHNIINQYAVMASLQTLFYMVIKLIFDEYQILASMKHIPLNYQQHEYQLLKNTQVLCTSCLYYHIFYQSQQLVVIFYNKQNLKSQ